MYDDEDMYTNTNDMLYHDHRDSDDMKSSSFAPPPAPLTQHTAAKRPAAPTYECTGPASTGPRRIATEENGRVGRTATGHNQSRYE